MYLSKNFKIPIYGCTVELYIVKDIRRKAKSLAKREGLIMEYFGEAGALMFKSAEHTYFIILHEDLITHYFLNHELSHLCEEILEDRQVSDKEARAYLYGWMAQEMYNFLKIKSVKVG